MRTRHSCRAALAKHGGVESLPRHCVIGRALQSTSAARAASPDSLCEDQPSTHAEEQTMALAHPTSL
eukprot:7311514-Alexandrium_andersonii.AAC.1